MGTKPQMHVRIIGWGGFDEDGASDDTGTEVGVAEDSEQALETCPVVGEGGLFLGGFFAAVLGHERSVPAKVRRLIPSF
jgi:hypothetical protein